MNVPPYGAGAPDIPGTYVPPPVDQTPYVPGVGGVGGVGGMPGMPGGFGGGAPVVPQQVGYPQAAPYGAGGYPAAGGMPPQMGGMPPVGGMPGAYPGGYAAAPNVMPGAYPGAGMPPGGGYTAAAAPPGHFGAAGQYGKAIYHISVSATGLKARDGMFGKNDPYCVLSQGGGARPGAMSRVGRTETAKNNPNPMWSHRFVVEHPGPGAPPVQLKFEVFDEDRGRDDLMATVEVTLDQVLHSPGMRYEAHMSRTWTSGGGTLSITARRAH